MIFAFGGTRTRHHDDIERREACALLAERFSHDALDPVALYGRPGDFSGDGEAEAGPWSRAGDRDNTEQGVAATPARSEYSREIDRRQQALR